MPIRYENRARTVTSSGLRGSAAASAARCAPRSSLLAQKAALHRDLQPRGAGGQQGKTTHNIQRQAPTPALQSDALSATGAGCCQVQHHQSLGPAEGAGRHTGQAAAPEEAGARAHTGLLRQACRFPVCDSHTYMSSDMAPVFPVSASSSHRWSIQGPRSKDR